MDIKVSKDKYINRWVDWEKLIYIRWNSIKNCEKNEEFDSRKDSHPAKFEQRSRILVKQRFG